MPQGKNRMREVSGINSHVRKPVPIGRNTRMCPEIGKHFSEKVFVETFLQTWNGAYAADKAGYHGNFSRVQAKEIFSRKSVKEMLNERIKELQANTDEVYMKLTDHMRGSMDFFINEETNEIDLDKARRLGKMHLIKKIKSDERGTLIELYSAQDAAIQLAKVLGMLHETSFNKIQQVNITPFEQMLQLIQNDRKAISGGKSQAVVEPAETV